MSSKPDPAVAAIKFALTDDDGSEAATFLRLWLEGDFAAIRRDWDDVPEEVFIGADPLHKLTVQEEREWTPWEFRGFSYLCPPVDDDILVDVKAHNPDRTWTRIPAGDLVWDTTIVAYRRSDPTPEEALRAAAQTVVAHFSSFEFPPTTASFIHIHNLRTALEQS